ncbi:VOC family protein [Chloroflexota bacterium]
MPNYWYDHIHLVSPDPVKTAQFYQTLFGAELISTLQLEDGRTSVELDLNGSRVLVINLKNQPESESPPAAGYGIRHFGIRTDDLKTAVEDLKASGVKFTEEIRTARPGVQVSFLLGPENVLIELLERNE